MTTFMDENVTCYMCKISSDHTILVSTIDLGSPDLDLRPPKMRRSTINTWIQCCPHCGYVAAEIGEKPVNLGIVQNVKASAEWGQPASIPTSGLVLNFLRLALLEMKFARAQAAAEAALCAAWVADDGRKTVLSIECRTISAQYMTLALSQMDQGNEQRETMEARLVDILRRSRKWRDAEALCRHALASGYGGIVDEILRFQRTLIQRRLVGARSVDDAQRASASATT